MRNSVIYGIADKGVSIQGGNPLVEDCLIADTLSGIVFKHGGDEYVELVDTVRRPLLDGVVVWGNREGVRTDYLPAEMTVTNSVLDNDPGVSGSGIVVGQDPYYLAPWGETIVSARARHSPMPAGRGSSRGGTLGTIDGAPGESEEEREGEFPAARPSPAGFKCLTPA